MASKKELRSLITLAGKIDPSLQSAMMKATKMNTNMVQQSKKSAGAMSSVWTIAKGVFGGNLMTKGLSMVVGGIKAVSSQGIELGSNLTEVQNVVDTTFGKSSKTIDSWSQNALNAFGLSELQAKQFTGTLGAMLKSSGINGKYLVQMSQGAAGLAGDFASFYNLDHEEAFTKIRAGLSGETEPLKQLGINMSVANLEAFALSKGIKTSYKDMDQASQTLLRYNYLMETSKDAQGDFAKTLDTSYANQKRLFQTNLQQKMAGLWQKSLPMVTKGFKLLNDYMGKLNVDKLGDAISNKLGSAFNLVVMYGPPLVTTFKNFGISAYNAFQTVKPPLNWLVLNGIPAVVGIASELLKFKPVIWGVVGAVAAYKGIMLGLAVAQGISKAATMASIVVQEVHNGLLLLSAIRSGGLAAGTAALAVAEGSATVAQWALNAAMSANPIALVVVGIGALIAAGVLLYKNWDKVSNFFVGVWDKIKGVFTSGINNIIGNLNWMIEKINIMPGINIPLIPTIQSTKGLDTNSSMLVTDNVPAFAKGGFTDQPSIFGEAGPEAAIPLKYRNPRSISILNQTAKAIGADNSAGKPPISFNFNFNGPVSNKEDVISGVKMSEDYIMDIIEKYFGGRPSFG